jgi:hypothetical protein
MSDERIAKLPRWAREHIDSLDRKIADLEAGIAKRNGETGTGFVTVDHWRTPITLPDESRIRWRYDHHTWVDARDDDGTLQIMGSTQLIVYPHVTNVIRVRLAQR